MPACFAALPRDGRFRISNRKRRRRRQRECPMTAADLAAPPNCGRSIVKRIYEFKCFSGSAGSRILSSPPVANEPLQRQRTQPPVLGNLRRYRRSVLCRMERIDAYARDHPLNCYQGAGTGGNLGPLVPVVRTRARSVWRAGGCRVLRAPPYQLAEGSLQPGSCKINERADLGRDGARPAAAGSMRSFAGSAKLFAGMKPPPAHPSTGLARWPARAAGFSPPPDGASR